MKTGYRLFYLPLLVLTSVLLSTPIYAADEPGASNAQLDAILDELRSIRQVLQRMEQSQRNPTAAAAKKPAAQPKTRTLSIQDRPVLGDPKAPVTLVELVDFQCPFCKRFFKNSYPLIKEKYIDKGLVRLVIKDLPLGFHGEARQAAQAAHCAGEQDAYWGMHDMIHGRNDKLDQARLTAYAEELKLDLTAFKGCIASSRHLDHIDSDALEANNAGISGTPSFIVGASAPDSIAGTFIRGAQPYAVFEKAIEAELASQKKQDKP